jgi:hypothetical protein
VSPWETLQGIPRETHWESPDDACNPSAEAGSRPPPHSSSCRVLPLHDQLPALAEAVGIEPHKVYARAQPPKVERDGVME